MKFAKLMCMTLFTALAIPPWLAAQEPQNHMLPHYKVTDLGTLGGTFSQSEGVNNIGWTTGFATLPGDQSQHGFLWRRGLLTDLGTLGGQNSVAFVPNDRGVIPGFSETSTPDPSGEDVCGFGTNLICLPVLWTNSRIIPLPTLGGNNGQAYVINQRGQVGGFAENSTLDKTCPVSVLEVRAVVWEKGKIRRQLDPLPGDISTLGGGINDLGDVPAASGNCQTILHALLWRHDGTVTDLGNLGGTMNNNAFGINNHDQVTGFSNLPGDTTHHAFLWTKERGMQDLGTLPGDVLSETESINDRGQVPGVSCDINFNCRAFLWQNGVMTDLNTLTPLNSPLYLSAVYDINELGQVVGIGLTPDGDLHAFLGTPCDENHPKVKGCDYTLVDAIAAPPSHPAFRESSGPRSPADLQRSNSRYRRFAPIKGPAHDPDRAVSPNQGIGSGYCALDTTNKLTGACIAGTFDHSCAISYDDTGITPGQVPCPPGQKAIEPTNFSCAIGQVSRVDGARNCVACGGRCVLGRCSAGCSCGTDNLCHKRAPESLREMR